MSVTVSITALIWTVISDVVPGVNWGQTVCRWLPQEFLSSWGPICICSDSHILSSLDCYLYHNAHILLSVHHYSWLASRSVHTGISFRIFSSVMLYHILRCLPFWRQDFHPYSAQMLLCIMPGNCIPCAPCLPASYTHAVRHWTVSGAALYSLHLESSLLWNSLHQSCIQPEELLSPCLSFHSPSWLVCYADYVETAQEMS